MKEKEIILFDCMETLIDMVELPTDKEYALWALEGSGMEVYWKDNDKFVEQFLYSRKIFKERKPYEREYSLSERLQLVVEFQLGKDAKREGEEIVRKLVANFWEVYSQKCYVASDVKETLKILGPKYKIGVVSNFLIKGGIEELIKDHGIEEFFQFIVSSVSLGWRKPHPNIYQEALRQANCSPTGKVLFIGDDYQNDYVAPRKLGMRALLYDRNNKYPQVDNRFICFQDLPDKIDQVFRIYGKEIDSIG